MKIKKNLNLIVSSLLMCSMLFMAGCNVAGDEDKNNGGSTSGIKVGDELAGGFTVSYVDTLSGYEATRDVEGGEKQTLVSGRFGSDRTWSKDRVYYLADAVFIGNDNTGNCTLTIEAGTTVKGETSSTKPGALVITRGSKINAVGSAAAPIVFTSAKAASKRAAGDWGGIIINGNAKINDGDAKGEAQGEGGTGTYGGDNDDDNSGVLKYVRVEFAGTLFSPDNELNGIAFQGVGRGTVVDYIQVHRNADDGVEFFGGSVNVSHVVITGASDDSFDWTSGWTGSAQFVVLQQYDGIGDCGIEADSNKNDAAAAPVSNPTLANFTIIGQGVSADETALKFRRGTNATLANTAIKGFKTIVSENSKDSDAGTIDYNGVIVEDNAGATANANAVDWAADSDKHDGATLNIPATSLTSVDVKPASAITTTATAADLTTAAADTNLNIVDTDFFGAIDAGSATPWYANWTATPEN